MLPAVLAAPRHSTRNAAGVILWHLTAGRPFFLVSQMRARNSSLIDQLDRIAVEGNEKLVDASGSIISSGIVLLTSS